MTIAVAAALLALSGAGAGTAHAGVVATVAMPLEGSVLAGGPALSGDTVIWPQAVAPEDTVVLREAPAAGGAAPRTLTTLPPAVKGVNFHTVDLRASPTRVAFFEAQGSVPEYDKYQQGFTVGARIVSGPPGGPFATVAGCVQYAGCGRPACFASGMYTPGPDLALAGDGLAFTDACTPEGTGRVGTPVETLRRADLSADPVVAQPSPVALGGRAPALRALTGDLIATGSGTGAIAVSRIADGSSLGAYPALPGLAIASLQNDGKLAAEVYGRHDKTAVWVAPGDPVVHRLPVALDRAAESDAQIAGDHVVLQVPHGLDAVGLDGGAAAPLLTAPAAADDVHVAATIGPFAFDGTRVVWAVTQCERTMIGVSALGDAPQAFPPAVCDGPRLLTRRSTADRHGRYAVLVTCARACSGTLRQSFFATPRTWTRFRLPGSPRPQRVVLRVPARVLRSLRRGRTLHPRVNVVQQHLLPVTTETLRLRR